MWSADEAKDCMEKMLQYVDILIANEEDADKVLGIRAVDTDVTTGKLNKAGYVDVAAELCKMCIRDSGCTAGYGCASGNSGNCQRPGKEN